MEMVSPINYLLGQFNYVKPEVGMPVTILYCTDRRPGTIVKVSKSGKKVYVQRDSYECISGNIHAGNCEYKYSQNPNGEISIFTFRKNGVWREQNAPSNSGKRLRLGTREYYYDPHF